MNICKPNKHPLDCELDLQENVTHNGPLQELVGSLQNLARCSRSNIQTAVKKLSMQMSAYIEQHRKAAKSVLKYLKSSQNFSLKASKAHKHKIETYFRASYGSEPNRRSMSGTLILLNSPPVV
jgi:hypothetical protein